MSVGKIIRRFLKYGILTIAGILVLSFLFISPILEYVIEKYSKQWTGRYIFMDDLDFNILNGKLEFENLKMMEADDKTIFFSCKDLLVNFTLYRIIAGDYYISKVALQDPFVRIVRSLKGFNFDDLLAEKEGEKKEKDTTEVHFQVRDISVTNGKVDYINSDFENKIAIADIKLYSEGIAWDDKETALDYAFSLDDGGNAKGNFRLEYESGIYYVKTIADQLSLKRLNPYIKDFLLVENLNGFLNCDLVVSGNVNESTDIALAGDFDLSDILISIQGKDSLVALKNFSLGIDSVNFRKNDFRFSHINLNGLYVLYEQYANGKSNFEMLLKVDSTAVQSGDSTAAAAESSNPFLLIADFVKQIAQSYDMNSYQVDSFLFDEGRVTYSDYSMLETFTYHLTNLEVSSNTLDSKLDLIEIDAHSDLNYTGKFDAELSFNPKNYMDMDVNYKITDVRLTDMSPHTVFYLAHPFMDGIANYESHSTIRNMQLKSSNDVLITKVNVGNKVYSKNAYDVPFRLAVALLRDVKGNIDLSIPVEGDLSDPNYKLGKVIIQILLNILIKAVTSPYRIIAHSLSVDENDVRQISFNYLDTAFTEKQLKSVDHVARILESKQELTARFVQFTNFDKEAERYASYESRKLFLADNGKISSGDSLSEVGQNSMESITILDSTFVQWIDAKLGEQQVYMPVQQKILMLTGEEKIKAAVNSFVQKRELALREYVISSGIDTSRCMVMTEKPESIPATEVLPQFHIYFDVKE